MYCVKSLQTTEEVIKKSRFIGIITPCETEDKVLSTLKQLDETYPDASHIAFAYRIKSSTGLISRFHDAGEPTGTAGRPIFKHLEGKQLINILGVVVRYFGGIKLGAGGLTRAYGNAAANVIAIADIIPYVDYVTVSLCLDYNQMRHFEYQLKKLAGKVIQQDFTAQVNLLVSIPKDNVEILAQLFRLESMPVS